MLAQPANSLDEFARSLLDAGSGLAQLVSERIPQSLQERYVGILSLADLLVILCVIIATLLVRWLVILLLDRGFELFHHRRKSDLLEHWNDVVIRLSSYIILISGLFLLASSVSFPRKPIDVELAIWRLVTCVLLIFAGLMLFRVLSLLLHYLSISQTRHDQGLIDRRTLPLLRDVTKVLVVIGVAISIVQVWGYSATTILAGVGLGGLALAFAAQDSIANVFGSMVIYADRPYKAGDWVMLNNIEGTIEEIGIRSTRIRTFDNTLVSVPNKLVANESVQNYTAMNKRRIRFFVGVRYDTDPAQLEKIRDRIYALITGDPELDNERSIVRLWQLGASSLDFLVQCHTPLLEMQDFGRVQERLLLNVLRELADLDVNIAFPSQSIYLEQDMPAPTAPPVPAGPPQK